VRVVHNEDQVPGHGLSGDKHIIGADRRSVAGEQSPDLAGLPGVLGVELEHEELEGIDQSLVLCRPPAFQRTIERLAAVAETAMSPDLGSEFA
jgi:hypothetical protein